MKDDDTTQTNLIWGHFHRTRVDTGVYVYDSTEISEVEWSKVFSFYARKSLSGDSLSGVTSDGAGNIVGAGCTIGVAATFGDAVPKGPSSAVGNLYALLWKVRVKKTMCDKTSAPRGHLNVEEEDAQQHNEF